MNFVTNRLAVGGRISDQLAVQTLLGFGITHIVNCQKEHCDLPLLHGTTIEYVHCPTHDDMEPKEADWFEPGLVFALKALALPKTKVYVHCMAGINRGPSMAYAILRAQGLEGRLARALIKEARPEVLIHYRHDADRVIKSLGYE